MLHPSEVFTTDAHQLDRLLVTAMAFASAVELQLRKYAALRGSGCRSRTAPAWRQRVPSTSQSSPHSRVIPMFSGGKADDLLEPVDYLAFDLDGRVISASAARVRCPQVPPRRFPTRRAANLPTRKTADGRFRKGTVRYPEQKWRECRLPPDLTPAASSPGISPPAPPQTGETQAFLAGL
jgi:hypothetical protein